MLTRAGPYLAGVMTGLLAAGLILVLIAEPRGRPVTLSPPPSPQPIRVHLSGAVTNPGVYSLPRESIVEEAIIAAGGALTDADLGALNLAAPVQDGQRVIVPFQAEATAVSGDAPEPAVGLLNVNTATAPELERLPGIGPTLAQTIVDYRERHGPFQSIEDLLDVPGIGPARIEQIRSLVSLY